jgi:SAM-dependent methyltransferase
MKKLIKKLIPLSLWESYRKMKVSKFKNKSTEEVFTQIYDTNYWKSDESISGQGSEMKQVQLLINELDRLIADKNITTILDIPCGDFNWMKKVNLSKVTYIGADIVEKLIQKNTESNKDLQNVSFRVLDLTNDVLPKSDLIIVRDCLVHLSYEDIFKAVKNIKASGCTYLFTTTYPNHHQNYDIITGDWRKLNLMAKPFNFPEPISIFNERCTEGNGEFADKSMLLWDLSSIN